MAIELKLQAFEGPLDLLLHLIEKNKVSIYDIPIALITEQYMEYIDAMTQKQLQMDVMSEFLVMAATLLDIKSRMLLPAEKDEEGEEIDPREELVRQLLEYKTYKYMSFELRERENTAQGVWVRRPSIPRQVQKYREPVDPDEVLDKAGVTLRGLYGIFQEVMKRREDLRDPVRSGFGRIEKQQIDAQEAILYIERFIMNRRHCTFRSLLMLREGRMYTVVAFLTILELMKRGRVYVTQDDNFGEIRIEANDPSMWNDDGSDFMSEWSEDSDRPEGAEGSDGTA